MTRIDYAFPNVDRIEAVHVISEVLARIGSAFIVAAIWWVLV